MYFSTLILVSLLLITSFSDLFYKTTHIERDPICFFMYYLLRGRGITPAQGVHCRRLVKFMFQNLHCHLKPMLIALKGRCFSTANIPWNRMGKVKVKDFVCVQSKHSPGDTEENPARPHSRCRQRESNSHGSPMPFQKLRL